MIAGYSWSPIEPYFNNYNPHRKTSDYTQAVYTFIYPYHLLFMPPKGYPHWHPYGRIYNAPSSHCSASSSCSSSFALAKAPPLLLLRYYQPSSQWLCNLNSLIRLECTFNPKSHSLQRTLRTALWSAPSPLAALCWSSASRCIWVRRACDASKGSCLAWLYSCITSGPYDQVFCHASLIYAFDYCSISA